MKTVVCLVLFFIPMLYLMSAYADSIEISPSDYGKFGLTPFVGPISDDGTQEITLIFNQKIHAREISKVELLFFSSKKVLILANDTDFNCQKQKCFITFDIIPDYQYNIEFEFIYGEQAEVSAHESDSIRYRIKDIGLLTGRVNRKHK